MLNMELSSHPAVLSLGLDPELKVESQVNTWHNDHKGENRLQSTSGISVDTQRSYDIATESKDVLTHTTV